MHSKYDHMHTNRIFNALNYINNHVNSCKNCMLSGVKKTKCRVVQTIRGEICAEAKSDGSSYRLGWRLVRDGAMMVDLLGALF